MLEGVLRLRVERLLVKELGTRQSMKSAGQVSIAKFGNARENRFRELLADHRRGLKQPLLPLGEAVDPRCEYALHRRGQADLCRGCDQAVRTPGARDDACLN